MLTDLAARFRAAADATSDLPDAAPELLPARLSRACTAVLPVDAAGLGLFNQGYRVPLGASDPTAVIAERYQFTVGDGPCLEAARTGRAVVADTDLLLRRWSAYAQEFLTHTPYRAVVSVPLEIGPAARAALDLYLVDPTRLDTLSFADVSVISDQVVAALALWPATRGPGSSSPDAIEQPTCYGPAARSRTFVWLAMGIVMTKMDLDAHDALAVLRSSAFAHDTTVDDLASAIVDGRLDVEKLHT